MGLIDYINKSKKLVKKESSSETKLAFLSNFNIDGLAEAMKVLCYEHDIYSETYVAPYNQYIQEILNRASNLYSFSPNIIFILIDIEHLLGNMYYFPYRMSREQRGEIIKSKFDELKDLIEILEKNTKAKIIVNSLLQPFYSSRGILENKQESGLLKLVRRFNDLLEDLSKENSQLFIFDMNNFCSKVGYKNLIDKKMSYIGDMMISPSGLIELAEEYLSYIFPLMSKTKKCIVLDLDNTLWGGVIGEDGIDNLELGPEKTGKPFVDFQKRLLELSERGILLAINSKNNYEDAMEVIRNHRYMILKENHFASIRINWNDKASNMEEIAKELNIGTDSLVFIDDDKTNRELVKKLLPRVMILEMPEDPALYTQALENLKLFNSFNLTEEDLQRRNMYVEQRKRKQLESSAKDIDSFLKELKIKVLIGQEEESQIPRIAQLTQKTNQFNLTTKRYSEEDIKNFFRSDNHSIKFIHVKDNFGDYGLTGVSIVEKFNDKNFWKIDSFLLSCRILGKGIEFAFIERIIEEAKKAGIKKIYGEFMPTEKNDPAKNFLVECGFDLHHENSKKLEYILEIGKEKRKSKYIEIIEWKP